MAFTDPESAFDNIEQGVTSALHAAFPIVGKDKVLKLERVSIDRANKDPQDIASQYKARMDQGSWTVPVYGHLVLEDREGKRLGATRVKLMDVPRMTNRLSFIHAGQEYQVTNQWQLKPGVYSRRKANGELEAQFNVTGRAAFRMTFDPEKKTFELEYKKAHLPAYPILKAMGVTDQELESTWGKEILKANQEVKRNASALAQFHRTSTNSDSPSSEKEALDNLHKVMEASKLRPEVTEQTLGKKFEHVTGDALRLASGRILAVHNGAPEDDRDAIIFKSLRSTGELLHDQIKNHAMSVATKVQRQLNKGEVDKAQKAFVPGMFNVAVRKLFESSIANPAKQINPLDMFSSAQSTTIMGPGGIQSDNQITDEAKMIHPSQFGFVDALATPEGSSTGVVLRLPLGVRKIGDQPHIPLINTKTGKKEWVDPLTAYRSKVVLADQVRFKDGKVVPLSSEVKMMGKDNRLITAPFHEADYVMPHASVMFNLTSALVPFVGNDSGNRVSMAVRHLDQSISLKDRQKPLVQVEDPSGSTFEKTFGHQTAHVAPVGGVVKHVSSKGITVQGEDGKSHYVHLYDRYPLNDTKSMLHSTPVVKVGDKVSPGQLLADNNYTKDGVLALGTNLRVAYMPYHGQNFEDSVVITESAAKKLTSEHLHKYEMPLTDTTVLGRKTYMAHHPGVFSMKQLDVLDDEGVVKVGAKVKPGDPLVLAVQPYSLKDRVGLGALRKSLMSQHVDKAMRWDSDHEGEVVAVHKTDKGYQVHVRTAEPMQVADKLCFDEQTEVLTRAGWKPVAQVTLCDEVCCLVNGEIVYQTPSEVHGYTTGGRMYRVETQQIDLFVTANHRMYVQQSTRNHGKPFRLVPASEVAGKRVRYKKDGNWKGSSAAAYGSGVLGLSGRWYLALLGMFLSEGCCVNSPKSGTYGIDIAQVKPQGRQELFAALDIMGLRYTKTPDRARIHSKAALAHFQVFGKAKDKFIPNEVFEYPKEDLEVLFRWLMWGDGHISEGQPVCYTTTSRRLADDVQRLCLHIGKAANIKVDPAHEFVQNGRTYLASERYNVRIINSKLTPEVNHHHVGKQRAQHEEFVEDYRGPVYCVTVPGHVLYVRRNGKPCWSGNSNRHGGKGVVGYIIPDSEAPKDKDGKPVDIMFNPTGLGGRMNIGQVLETMAGKIAQKTNQTYVVKNFDPSIPDRVEHMKGELKKHGLSDTEELFDPKTGLSYGKVLVGPQQFEKLVHQAEKKASVRSGMGLPGLPSTEKYDSLTFQPAGGGGTGGQSYGQLGLYALLAHGATNILREGMTHKAAGEDPETNEGKRWKTGHADAWIAMQKGLPLPPPRPTFAFHRFTELLKSAGVNVEKQGSQLMLSPLTDKQILAMSKGEITDPSSAVHSKIDPEINHFKPIKNGLFDEKITGGHGGVHWGHVSLAEPLPNPLFEDPIKKILGITGPTFDAILQGTQRVDPATGKTVDKGGVTGGAGIKTLLSKVDVRKELEKAKKELKTAPASKVDALYRKARYLAALDEMGLKPDEAYILHHVPVIPPKLRPINALDNNALRYEDMNGLYMRFGQMNTALKDPTLHLLADKDKANARAALYESVSTLFGSGTLPEGAKVKGVLHQIAGSSPKVGLFQRGLLSPRQDSTMRAVIIPGPDLHLDQVGLPRDYALAQFRPYVVKNLVQLGAAKTTLEAQALLADFHLGKRKDPIVWHALEKAVSERPVLLKRDPALHKESIMAFKPTLIAGNSIKLHPLVTGGFNADHDGDSCEGEVILLRGEGERLHSQVVDLKDFPREEGSLKTVGNIDTYSVPPSTYVYGAYQGAMRACRVLEYSVHKDLEVWEVTLDNGQVIRCSGDHSLAVLDMHTLEVTRMKPAEARGQAVPVMGLLPETGCKSLVVGKRYLPATPEMGSRIALLWIAWKGASQGVTASQRAVDALLEGTMATKDEWASVIGELLRQVLPLPLDFRRALLSGILDKCIRRHDSSIRSDSRTLEDLQRLALSCGVYSRRDQDVVFFHAATLRNAEWFRPSWSKSRLKNYCKEMIPLPSWVREELQGKRTPGGKVFSWVRRGRYRRKMYDHRQQHEPSTFARVWDGRVLRGPLKWAKVVSVRNTGERKTLYDLTVEGALTFTLSSGVVVWDTMSVYVPDSEQAVQEAHRMLPSKNIFNEATLSPSHVPTMESRLGLHRLSLVRKPTNLAFSSVGEALDAVATGKLHINDQVQLNGKPTTPGRMLLASAAPEAYRDKLLHNFKLELHGKGLKELFDEVGRKNPKEYAPFVDAFKDLGNDTSTGMIRTPLSKHKVLPVGVHSFSLDDFITDKATRDPHIQKAQAEVAKIQKMGISEAEKTRRTVDTYLTAFQGISKTHMAREAVADERNRLYSMTVAGVKPSKDQYTQMRIAPGVMKDSKGDLLPTPILKSYGEGLTLADYWIGSYGARSGAVKKVQEVQEPGYMTKLLQNTSMATLIDQHDCGTTQGLKMSVNHSDIADRHLAQEFKAGSLHLPAGTLLSKDRVDQIRSLDPSAELMVRSPLHCHSDKGICQKCFGLAANGHHHAVGTNVGVLSAHALGERAVQLTLKAFHSGGSVSSRSGGALGAFQRLEQLTYLPDKTPNSAALSRVKGTVTKVEQTSTGTQIHIDGVPHFVGKDGEGRDLHQDLPNAHIAPGYKPWTPPVVGMKVERGQMLSDPNRTLINPHRLYEATGDMGRVQHFMADELHKIYEDEGVRKRAVETVVRAMGNVTKISDPHDHPDLLRGQFYSRSAINKINQERQQKGQKLIEHTPSLIGVDLLPLAATEDWMAVLNHQKLRSSIKRNAALGAVSELHGAHPIPGLAYGAEFGRPPAGSKTPY